VIGAGDKVVTLGRVLGPWGVKGWIKVYSYTDPRENIVHYSVWTLRRGSEVRLVTLEQGRGQGKDVVAKLAMVDDRDAAEALAGADIVVERSALEPCAAGEFYWADLEGLRVLTAQGEELGRVTSLFGTGSNDVMVVVGERERLIPFIVGAVVRDVQLEEQLIVVDWDPSF
jgi:16S rRNA processing protein RimM